MILSTWAMLAVPWARAPIAWAPPTAWTSDTPSRWAVASTSGWTSPLGPGGEVRAISPTPAIWAGITFINTVLG